MYRDRDQVEVRKVDGLFGGEGIVYLKELLDPAWNLQARLVQLDEVILEPGASIGRHENPDRLTLFYVLSGRGRFDVAGEPHTITGGDVIHVRPGVAHGLQNEEREPLRILILQLHSR